MILNKLSCKVAIVSVISLIIISVLVYVLLFNGDKDGTAIKPNSPVLTGKYSRAAIVTNEPPCASIAKNILLKGGKAVDGIIAALLCEGVTSPHRMGAGGGFFMTFYEKASGNVTTIVARETAPAAATVNMFHGDSKLSQKGALAAAIPAEIKGYWTAYTKFGRGVPWEDLFQPTIKLCEEGIPINEDLESMFFKYEEEIHENPGFRELFLNQKTGFLLKAGEKYKNIKLANTLRTIANSTNGGDAFYKGPIAEALVADIQEGGGIITESDLENFDVRLEESLKIKIFNNLTLHTVPPPGSGAVLGYILKIIDGIIPSATTVTNVHRITEAMKYAYGARSKLGDPHFVNATELLAQITSDEFTAQIRSQIDDTSTSNDPAHYGSNYEEPKDKGTANLAVIAENGDAVVATSSINTNFGSFFVSKRTGVLLNNQMDDFASPNITNFYNVKPTEVNYIAPGKIPMSSMCPSIILDPNGNIRLIVGGAGGTKITTNVAMTIIENILFERSIDSAIEHIQFHHQLIPMVWQYYPLLPKFIVDGMKKIGHKVQVMARTSFVAVTAIERKLDGLYPCSDYRRPGQVEGY